MKKLLTNTVLGPLFFLTTLVFVACNPEETPSSSGTPTEALAPPSFKPLSVEQTGVDFQNTIKENDNLNYFNYMHLYIGGGVAAGDLDNDGLPELFFISSIGDCKLYHNEGNMQFKEITAESGVQVPRGFNTGVNMADINGDGLLDIYVSRSGWFEDPNERRNLMFINQGGLKFSEEANQRLLDDPNHSIHASFFDYDEDGDLDAYLVNTAKQFELTRKLIPLDMVHQSKDLRQYAAFDRMLENDGSGRFTEVTEKAGIFSDIGFGFGISSLDHDADGNTDIFVGNDFVSPDYLYMNNGDKTFTERSKEIFRHTSFYSMGTDAADVNKDGYMDLFVLDMLPEDYRRSKTTMSMVRPELFEKMVEWEHNYQYMHNVLQVSRGPGIYSEIGQFAGIQKTDWSWSCLFQDFNLDTEEDLYVTNGILRDITNQDYMDKAKAKVMQTGQSLAPTEVLSMTGSEPIPNYLFMGKGGYQFENVAAQAGVGQPSFSNGAAIADLDGDGDMDIVANNINSPAFIYQNQAVETKSANYLKIVPNPKDRARFENCKIYLYGQDGQLIKFQEFTATRGLMSRSQQTIIIGLGKNKKIGKLEIIWPDEKMQVIESPSINQTLTIAYADATGTFVPKAKGQNGLLQTANNIEPAFQHQENVFNDFAEQILLPHRQSQNGPSLAKGDVDGDGLEDFYIGGAKDQAGALYLQNANGTFRQVAVPALQKDAQYEDLAAVFFDANGDQQLDLYVVSGGIEWPAGDAAYQDRLYLNSGSGQLVAATQQLPKITSSGGVVAALDIDQDQDLDLFVGGRVIPGKYPFAPQSYVLINEGGTFTDGTQAWLGDAQNIGMITAALPVDFNGDQRMDLVVTGEWLPIIFLQNNGQGFQRAEGQYLSQNGTGWWNHLQAFDADADGDLDLLCGNLGLNYKFHASPEKPFEVYCNDFDQNGVYDVVLAKRYKDRFVPVRGRTCSSEQMPFIKEKFPSFESFAEADLSTIYGEEKLEEALHMEATEFANGILFNENGKYVFRQLPTEAQFAPINGSVIHDFTGNGHLDLLIAGNHYGAEVETTRADAGLGLLLEGDGQGGFKALDVAVSGVYLPGDVKELLALPKQGQKSLTILAACNDDHLQALQWQAPIQ